MGILLILKEGGSLAIDTIGNKPIQEDLDLIVGAGSTISLAFREIMEALSVTNTTSTKARAIVMGSI
jgi:hypothetical protein